MNTPDDKVPDPKRPAGNVPDLDDPDWVDNIVKRAVEKAEAEPSTPTSSVDSPQPQPEAQARPTTPTAAASTSTKAGEAAPQAARHEARPSEAVAAAPVAELNADGVFEGVSTPAEEAFFQDGDETVAAEENDVEENDEEQTGIRMRQLVEWIAVIVGALLVALVIKTFLIQPFYIPSGSMSPTLNKDDRILVNKLSYDLHDVNRGDIVVFETPENFPNRDVDNLVKRVIALEGETINFSDGEVVIDDRLLNEPYIAEGLPSTWTAGLPPGCAGEESDPNEGCTIPEGHVFVMGDNRTGSDDGRVFGPIPEDLIVGRAFLRVWPLGEVGFL
jgi:signal peptidase I